jgi:CRP/FNR family cyclic AMP-dependent transcriptional regulator
MLSDDDGSRQILAGSVVFQDLPPGDLDHIITVGLLVEAKAGDMVLSEQARGPGLYVVLEGLVEVFLPEVSASGRQRPSRVRLNTLGPGRCLGEYSLIDEHSASASARAETSARLFFLSREEFRRIAEGDPRVGKVIYLNLLRFLVKRLRAKDQDLDIFVLNPEEQARRG